MGPLGSPKVPKAVNIDDGLCVRIQAADVYAFGILLWEMCTGQKPWVGLKEQEIITKVVQNEKQPLFPRDTPAPFKVGSITCIAEIVPFIQSVFQGYSSWPIICQVVEMACQGSHVILTLFQVADSLISISTRVMRTLPHTNRSN